MKRILLALGLGLIGGQWLAAEVVTKSVMYKDGDTTLEGFLAYDSDKTAEKSPGILVSHQWMGLTNYEKMRCEQLAELGYVAFAVDVYGQGVRPDNPGIAAKTAGIYKQDRQLTRRRMELGLKQLKSQPNVESESIAAIGYCFGGMCVLELARSGADIDGVVSFHGAIDSPSPQDGKNIKAKLLICHGADDPFESEADIDAAKAEWNVGKVDWQMNYYSGAVHSFTQPMAGSDNSKGAAYNEQADHRSWTAMQSFFDELW